MTLPVGVNVPPPAAALPKRLAKALFAAFTKIRPQFQPAAIADPQLLQEAKDFKIRYPSTQTPAQIFIKCTCGHGFYADRMQLHRCPICGFVTDLGHGSCVVPPVVAAQPQRTPIVPSKPATHPLPVRHVDAASAQCWRQLGWWDFEIAVLLAFERVGFRANATPPMSDGGIDGIVEKHPIRAGIQCKHFRERDLVTVDDVRAFIGSLHILNLSCGYFVTTGRYSRPAENEAKKSGIKVSLFTIHDLMAMGTGLQLTGELISAAKHRWNVPQNPPPGMAPQGPRRGHFRRWGR